MLRSLASLTLVLVATPGLGEASQSPAMQAYDDLSVYRDRHEKVIWKGEEATPEQLDHIVADLNAGLKRMDEPLVRDLAEGNLYLRFRRFNLLVDLIKVHARAGRPDAALAAWDALSHVAWLPDQGFIKDPLVEPLSQRAGFAPVKARHQAARWLAQAPALATAFRDPLPVEERIAGLSRLWSAAREAFVWFDHVPTLDWDRAYLDAIPRVTAANSTADYYRELMRLVAQLHDGHSNVYPPKALESQFYARPGLRTARVQGKVIVTEIRDPTLSERGLSIGDEILAIDGEAAVDYAERRVAPFVSSSTPQDREVRTYAYSLLAGDANRPVRLRLADSKGLTYELEAPRSGYETRATSSEQSFRVRADGVAVLALRQFSNDAGVTLLREHRADVEAAKALVIDLRGNGGGSSHYGGQVLGHLTDAPIPTTVSYVPESPPLQRAHDGDNAGINWRRLEGGSYDAGAPWTFRGPVALLIDARTFSAAEDTAAAFKLMKRGPVVGSPSGGSTGQPWSFALPGGGRARICVKRDEYPDGTSFVGVGVLPDIRLSPTVGDVRHGRDPVLERAVAQLLKDSRASAAATDRPDRTR